MTTIESRHTTPAKRRKPATSANGETPKGAGRVSAPHAAPSKANPADNVNATRVTKHDLVLTLLSRRDVATSHDLMEATD